MKRDLRNARIVRSDRSFFRNSNLKELHANKKKCRESTQGLTQVPQSLLIKNPELQS